MLVALYGVNVAMMLTPVLIPASVICMLILFFGLLILELILGTRRTSTVVTVVNIPAGFALKWINVTFTSPFILLPLAQSVSIAEAFEIGGVFVVGYLVMAVLYGYVAWGLQKITGTRRRAYEEVVSDGVSLELNTLNSGVVGESSARTDRRLGEEGGGRTGGNGDGGRSGNTVRSSIDGDKGDVEELIDEVGSSGAAIANAGASAGLHEVDSDSIYNPANNPPLPQRVAPITRLSMTVPQPSSEQLNLNRQREPQQPPPPGHSIIIANWIVNKFDWIVYSILLVIGVVIYYSIDYSLFLDLAVIILSYRTGLLVPPKYRLVVHPILVCSGITIFTIFITGKINNESLQYRLEKFKTGRNYLTLFKSSSVIPGAGDVLSTLLDVSIVSLAIPMYQYRSDLKRHFIVLIVSSLLASFTSFFIYPPLCYAIGISQTRSLAFIARSVTLALALPVVEAVGGSTSLVAVVTILSGIFGVLFGNLLMGKRGLRLRQDDYVTRGIIMGICSGAIGSVHLLNIDPRSSALASLSFFLYGIVLIILAVIPPIANIVREWVDLPRL